MVHEGLKNAAAGASPLELRRGMEKAVVNVVNGLSNKSKKITGNDILETISTIQNIYNDIELLKNNKYNYAFIKHKSIKLNTSFNTINRIIPHLSGWGC